MSRIRIDWAHWLVGAAAWSCAWQAQVVLAADRYGPWTFEDDTPFADTSRFVLRPTGPSFLDESTELVGNTPERCLFNLGYPCSGGPAVVELGFLDVPIVNGEGHDFVVFDAPFSPNVYEIAVQPEAGALTPYRAYSPTVTTEHEACRTPSFKLIGVPVDLSDYGLAAGTVVRHIRIKGDCATNPGLKSDGSEIDIAMAAVLRGANSCAATTCKPVAPVADASVVDVPSLPPLCPYAAKDCQPCKDSGECGTSEFPGYCAAHGFCAKCLTDAHCPSSPCAVGRCDAKLGQCALEAKLGCTAAAPPYADAAVIASDAAAQDAAAWQADDDEAAGCGCRTGRGDARESTLLLSVGLAWLFWRRRNRARV